MNKSESKNIPKSLVDAVQLDTHKNLCNSFYPVMAVDKKNFLPTSCLISKECKGGVQKCFLSNSSSCSANTQ